MLAFDGIWVPLVTPFLTGDGADGGDDGEGGGDAGAVDHAALHTLVQHLAQQGVAGFVACGSTGEAAMLDAAELDRVLATDLAAAGDKPVLMGLSGVRQQAVAQRAAQFVALHRLLRDQRLAEARALWRRLRGITEAAFAEPNPAPIKAALARQGGLHEALRAPLRPASGVTADALMRTLMEPLEASLAPPATCADLQNPPSPP